jgi:predicted TIM-barrel fold metal-dependent hydrolase
MRCDPVDRNAEASAQACQSMMCGCGSRRSFLKSFTAFGASTIAAPAVWAQGSPAPAPALAAKPHRIDIHHHFYPPAFIAEFDKSNERVAGVAKTWTIAKALDEMNRGGVATALWSIPFRQPKALDAEGTRKVTRLVNDYAAQGIKDNPGRFGLLAYLPLPDVDGALKEIEYALDVLKADGIGLFASYDDKWLGDDAFKPVMEELNRRKAVVYVHPLSPQCCGNLMSYVPASFAEYPQDTNRTVLSLLFSGTFSRLPDIRWIFSHGGAAVPLLAGRVTALAKSLYPKLTEMAPNGVDHELRRLHYETANAAYPTNMTALLKYVPLSQVMFGTDYPYIPITENVSDMLKVGLSAAELKAIDNENALRLIPRLKA